MKNGRTRTERAAWRPPSRRSDRRRVRPRATDDGLVIERAGQTIELPATYLAAAHIDHGYALTVHKAQGATYDVALFYGDERLYAEAGYTALTRGRDLNRAYVLVGSEAGVAPAHEQLGVRLSRHAAQPAAMEFD